MTIRHRKLGITGLSVSEIGLGAWQLGGDWGPIQEADAVAVLEAATQAGVSFWDTADVYGAGRSERIIGAFNQTYPDSERVIVTKAGRTPALFPSGYTEENLRQAINESRERLQLNTLPLVQLHCIPFDELKRGAVFEYLEAFRAEGLIAYYGASVETVAEALYCLNHTNVATLQIIFNVLRQDMAQDVLPLAMQRGVGIIVRLGLASGLLSGKMQKNQVFSPQDHRLFNQNGEMFNVGETFSGLPYELGIDLVEELKTLYSGEISTTPDLSMADIALRWLLDHTAVSSVITGASKPEQIRRNAAVSSLPALPKEIHEAFAAFYFNTVRQHIRGEI